MLKCCTYEGIFKTIQNSTLQIGILPIENCLVGYGENGRKIVQMQDFFFEK